MSLKSKIYGLIALFAMPFMILAGVNMITADTVDCGGETMQAGDTCVTTDHGDTTERDFSEQQDDNTAFGWFLLAASLVAGAWGAITVRMIVIERKDKQRSQLAQPGGFPQPGPGRQPNPHAPQPNQQQPWPQQQPGFPPNSQPLQQQPGFPPIAQQQQPYGPPHGQPGQR